ncbi:MAG TPA: aspartate kinase, partial [Tenuifilaceae bacterium]|nr:aspartate kinase [Tenuifilaceae bacterium]
MNNSVIRVFKFGGASVKSAEGIKNLATIVKKFSQDKVVVVVSAMGKTTNALERILAAYLNSDSSINSEIDVLKNYHYSVVQELVGADRGHFMYAELDRLFAELTGRFEQKPTEGYDFCYDQIVSFGELLATKIVSIYLNNISINNRWIDARTC